MPIAIISHPDGIEELVTVFDGIIRAEHADGTRCPRTGKGRHTQRPPDPRCPGRATYVAVCRTCQWEGQNTSRPRLQAETKAHARECDNRQPYIMTAQEFVNLPPDEQASMKAWHQWRESLLPEERPPVLTVAEHRERAAPPSMLPAAPTGLLTSPSQVPDATADGAFPAAVERAKAAGVVFVSVSRTAGGWCVYVMPETAPTYQPHSGVTKMLSQAVARLIREGDAINGGSTQHAATLTGVPDEYRARIYAVAFQNALAGDLDRLLRLWTTWR
ncbi:hypothetical protein M8Z33_41885 [Streptomyces sp. ZAF1911]|uniref:hypothetical protein n=1 Tax=Streptomyces sp. ZAF1911 TaxID=2944129 RepID=UPI00237AE289|nr:hypothetical protein [Streptomyces sp. ZAF1911]MDD9383089.1 hypothetical protein [Streptomyces sp. ZAF1911]